VLYNNEILQARAERMARQDSKPIRPRNVRWSIIWDSVGTESTITAVYDNSTGIDHKVTEAL